MSDTLSHTFIGALLAPRDRLYRLALAKAGTPARAEALLQEAVRTVYGQTAQHPLDDIPAAVEKILHGTVAMAPAEVSPAAVASESEPAMPADVWARLAATVQMAAAASAHPQGLHADSDLLKPDPMLAPKRRKARDEGEPFELSSPLRVLVMIAAALLAGTALTVYVLTRPGPSRPAQSSPANNF